jgi:transglutaminase-like putative cysteine protease
VVETGDTTTPEDGASWADLRSSSLVDRYSEFLEWTPYVPQHRELAGIARQLRKGRSPAEAVLAVSELVHDKLTYRPGTTGVHSSALDAWSAREGVCQNYAHVSLAMLRAIGIRPGMSPAICTPSRTR